ncbi:ThuA domain-containing protein [Arcticibacterium luteifluviistationis]|uniref:Crp/Fnr family transcriptional regulator n=1 Tax=Arcticibacterium luteifluviistationis TaxID=1784714 RepID=A0A2Z4GFB6_9BACT|nr:ThuA domain-containing protein [Arcticibacterium luteifluviistationis]AWV99735.1 Crp/Fnr family transcriptional regulator [Arcticibacterium luteifluviistationis]
MRNKIVALLCLITMAFAANAQNGKIKALLFTKTAGFHHESIHEGVAGIRGLAQRHSFQVDWQENSSVFTEEKLKNYDVVIFLNTTGDVLDDKQQAAFEKYIQNGGGYVGVHAAADTEYEWEWYTKMVGMMFKIHPAQQTAYLKVENSNFPGMERFPKKLLWTDEWYEYQKPVLTKDLNYLVSVDEKSYEPYAKWGETEGKGMGDFHPVSWYHNYDGGRAFYTGLGHIGAIYSDQTYLDHLYGGIYWAATGKGL